MLWEASDRICGKRLKPFTPMLVAAIERHGHLTLVPVVRERLEAISAATIARILVPVRKEEGGSPPHGAVVGNPPRRADPRTP